MTWTNACSCASLRRQYASGRLNNIPADTRAICTATTTAPPSPSPPPWDILASTNQGLDHTHPLQPDWMRSFIRKILFATAQEIGMGTGIVKNHLLIAPVHVFTRFVRSACTDTPFDQLCLDQSETALKAGRKQVSCKRQCRSRTRPISSTYISLPLHHLDQK